MPAWVVVATGCPSASTVTRRIDETAPGVLFTMPTISSEVVSSSPGRMRRCTTRSCEACTEVSTSSRVTPISSDNDRDDTITAHSGHTANTGCADTGSAAVVS
jgi:hypothetical protein